MAIDGVPPPGQINNENKSDTVAAATTGSTPDLAEDAMARPIATARPVKQTAEFERV
jgi:hypothetical protein